MIGLILKIHYCIVPLVGFFNTVKGDPAKPEIVKIVDHDDQRPLVVIVARDSARFGDTPDDRLQR